MIAGVFIAILSWSCTAKNPVDVEHTELNWVGTDVLYDATLEKKYLSLLFVLVDWCGYCQQLKSKTLTDPEVIQRLGESFNVAQINAESSAATAYMDTIVTCRYLADSVYAVRGYPTIILLDRSGALLETDPGYKDPERFVDMLDRMIQTY